MNVRDIQRRLLALGFNPGPLDGLPGRRTTAAVIALQKATRLEPDGVAGPKTLAVLNKAVGTGAVAGMPVLAELTTPPWVVTARSKMGLTEGNTSALAKLKAFLKSDGHTLGDPSKRRGAATSSRPASRSTARKSR
jgi:peptidoglycan hydrolase-like protein with peptidoglycan-binding domain